MIDYLKRSWAEVNLDALQFNMQQIKRRLQKGCMVLAVVKADGYGHGAAQVAHKLVECGVDWFGVSNIEEGMALRNHGLTQPILIFGTTPPELAGILAEQHITQTVYALEYAEALQQQAQAQGVTVDCHIKVDTGMTRLGFLADDSHFKTSLHEIETVAEFTNLKLSGIFTHFASADDYLGDAVEYTKRQFARFMHMVAELRAHGVAVPIRHCTNSAGTISYPEMHLDMVRPGVILYGMDPSDQCTGKIDLKPVMALKSVIASVKRIDAGTQVSYGRIYTTERDTTIAVVPIGYADGYSRNLSGKARMLVNGHFAPIIGRVCMDQLMLDVTGLPEVKRGDPVVIFGGQGDEFLSIDELANMLGTINYEITCSLSKRIPRVYVQNGKEVEVVHYIV
ncbi:alanine racemase [Hydrogenoanaerobacterium sp.]|uniref:alanine racemase n=1 Tax=Hydrogenoanaerobacterium sp. TaxID=2953763 RepID=UPI00289C7DD8|nr:alanine racemase [Hydrogenoanaerobacterium sp.]